MPASKKHNCLLPISQFFSLVKSRGKHRWLDAAFGLQCKISGSLQFAKFIAIPVVYHLAKIEATMRGD